MKSAERYDLEYIFTHIVKYGVIILKEVAHVVGKQKESLISITHVVSNV